MPYTDYSYLDPLHIIWRKGTEEDPYIDRVEYLKVVNHKVVLSEIPDRFNRVRIAGMIEINYDGTPKKTIAPNEFIVNYANGIVQFHESKEYTRINVMYKGKGFIQYPSSRIYHQDKMNDVVESLESIIDNSKNALDEARRRIEDYEEIRDAIVQKMVEIDTATTEAKEATEDVKIATDKALDAYETTRLVFKPFVNSFRDIRTSYPNPEIGWTLQVYDSGIRYRWDGIEWVPIDLFGGAIPLANETIDGLLSNEDFSKLRRIDEVTYSKRVLVFVLPSFPIVGIQPIVARFPFKGKIIGIKGICGVKGETETEIAIEKSKDAVNWNTIMQSNVFFRIDQFFDDGTASVLDENVDEGDLFRVRVVQQGVNAQNVTIEVMIETTIN